MQTETTHMNLNNGIYILIIKTSEGIQTKKIIKN